MNETLPAPIQTAGVIGGGTMGSGIVHVLLAAGIQAILIEADEAGLERAQGLVRASLTGAAERGKVSTPVSELMSGLTVTSNMSALADVAIVIEAVPEIRDLKKRLLTGAEETMGDDAVLATNTSSLSVAELGGQLRRPGRFLGMHFFNPVPVQRLVEVIRTEQTERAALDLAHQLSRFLGKETIEIKDSPGFATSRLGVALGLEAIRMVQEGVASAEDIDKGMTLGYRYPMGPCRLGDLVGHDVRLGIAEYLYEQLGPRFEPPQLLRDMVAEGRLGKKTGQGFYSWD